MLIAVQENPRGQKFRVLPIHPGEILSGNPENGVLVVVHQLVLGLPLPGVALVDRIWSVLYEQGYGDLGVSEQRERLRQIAENKNGEASRLYDDVADLRKLLDE